MFDLASHYSKTGMAAYSKLQEREFILEKQKGFRAVKHQSFVGAGYFDEVAKTISGEHTSVTALEGSTEEEQFTEKDENGSNDELESNDEMDSNDEQDTEVKIHKIEPNPESNEQLIPKIFRKRFGTS
jgi:hypothetical protein